MLPGTIPKTWVEIIPASTPNIISGGITEEAVQPLGAGGNTGGTLGDDWPARLGDDSTAIGGGPPVRGMVERKTGFLRLLWRCTLEPKDSPGAGHHSMF